MSEEGYTHHSQPHTNSNNSSNIHETNNNTNNNNKSINQDEQFTELLGLLETHTSLIPDTLMDFFMTKAGVQCDDQRLKHLVGLIGQKFITDIASDAMHFSRIRSGKSGGVRPGTCLVLEDLCAALDEQGISLKRPPYHI